MTRYANMKTGLPGPEARKLLERRYDSVPNGLSFGNPTFAHSAKGALVTDVDGNTFIDFAGAIGTINVGHTHPKVKAALKDQIDHFIHTGFNVMMYEPYVALAERLAQLAPGSHQKKVLLQNSGAEAVENAVKVARKHTKKQGVVTFTRGFHGRTLMAMSMTSKVKPYKYEFGPFAPEVYKAPYPYYYRKPDSLTKEEYDEFLLEEFKGFLINDVAPENIAAVVMEPVQGEGGFMVPSKRFVQGIHEICKEYGILFVSDEIQAGMARTGRYFAIEHFDVVPDIITVSKSLGAGVPISGVIGRTDIMDTAEPGELGGTYSGSPLGCRAALAVLDIIEEEKLNDRSVQIGETVMNKFNELASRFGCIGNVRGLGAMNAMEIVKDPESKEPDQPLTRKIIEEAGKRGLLLLSAGVHGNVIRMLMPIVITDEQLQEGLAILEEAVEVSAKAVARV